MCKPNATITAPSRPFLYGFTVTRGSEPVPYRAFLHECCRYPYVARCSDTLIAIWTVTILSALFPVVVPLSTVWFILKPHDKIDEPERPSASRVRPSDTIDEDDDEDELERLRDRIRDLEDRCP